MNYTPPFNHFQAEMLFEINGFHAQLCCSPESKAIAYRLRYRAYLHSKAIQPNAEEVLTDVYDEQDNSRTHLIWHEGQPIATVRSSIWSAKYDWATTESIKAFWKEAHRRIGLENNMLESSRYAVIPEFTGRRSLFAQLLLFRVQDLSSQLDQCKHIITSVRKKHVPFYQRMLGFQQISESKRLPWIDADIVLLTTSQAKSRSIITEKGMAACSPDEVERYASISNMIKAL